MQSSSETDIAANDSSEKRKCHFNKIVFTGFSSASLLSSSVGGTKVNGKGNMDAIK